MVIAVDFDGTIVRNGKTDRELITYLLEEQKNGSKVGLWTCRTGDARERAIEFCRKNGLVFDFVAEGKVYADCYLDSKAKRPEEVVGKNVAKGMSRQRMTRLSEQRGK